MTVNIPENSETAILQQEKPQQSEINKPKQEQPQQQEKKVEDGTQEDPNWKAFREARKKDRADREEAERKAAEKELEVAALKAAMEAAFSKPSHVSQPQQTYYENTQTHEETEDERIEKKVNAAIATRDAAYEKARIEREQQEYPNRLNQSYPDFQKIISQENLDYLDYHYPEISRPLQRLPEGFDKWSDIYHTVKKLVPNIANAKKDAAKAESNFNKPKSISSTGITQSGETQTFKNIEEKRAARYEEMKKIINSVS